MVSKINKKNVIRQDIIDAALIYGKQLAALFETIAGIDEQYSMCSKRYANSNDYI